MPPPGQPEADTIAGVNPRWLSINARLREVFAKDLFFIVGCPKSGTTWLQRMLNTHPQIVCRGEGKFGPLLLPLLKQALATCNARQTAGPDMNYTDEQLEYLFITTIGLYLSNALRPRPEVRCVGEKTPEHALLVPILAQLFPRAKFIQIIRDARDGIVSGWFANLRRGREFTDRFPDLPSYIAYYVNSHWIPYITTARSIAGTQPQRYFELRYEDLHAEPEPWIRRLLTFLEVDATDEAVARCRRDGSFERLSGGRQPGQEDPNSHFRKGIVGDWRNHFDQGCIETFMAHGGQMLRALGYEPCPAPA